MCSDVIISAKHALFTLHCIFIIQCVTMYNTTFISKVFGIMYHLTIQYKCGLIHPFCRFIHPFFLFIATINLELHSISTEFTKKLPNFEALQLS